MTEPETTQPKKKSESRVFLLALLLLVVLGTAYYISLGPIELPPPATDETADQAAEEPSTDAAASGTPATFNLELATKERVLGDTSAPIKISEHASFTCSHCAHFHNDTFKALKTNYIDTGKAYLVFSDFPLNAPALSASMLSRCVPEDRYFDFVGALFADQGAWAYETNYESLLKTKAESFGLSAQEADSCLKNEPLRDALIERMKAVQQQWEISATPSFVINNRAVLSGAMPYDKFEQELQKSVESLKEESTPDENTSAEGELTGGE
ncbi:MAG: DsbA family protein [Alphaproteobacteria bacterium]|nr:DsbA family protein [Alphaproteobacteria bacterium]